MNFQEMQKFVKFASFNVVHFKTESYEFSNNAEY